MSYSFFWWMLFFSLRTSYTFQWRSPMAMLVSYWQDGIIGELVQQSLGVTLIKCQKVPFLFWKVVFLLPNPPWISVALHGGGGAWGYGYFLELHILCRGFRIPIVNGIPDSSSCIPNSKAQDSVICYTAVFSVVTQRSSPGALHDDTKYGCVAD